MFIAFNNPDTGGSTYLPVSRIRKVTTDPKHPGMSIVHAWGRLDDGSDEIYMFPAEAETLLRHVEELYLAGSERHSQRMAHAVMMAAESNGAGPIATALEELNETIVQLWGGK